MTDQTNTPMQIDDEALDIAVAGLLLPAVQTVREAAISGASTGLTATTSQNAEVAVNTHRFDPYKTFKFK